MNHLLKKKINLFIDLKGDPLVVFKNLLKNFNIEKVYTNRTDYTILCYKKGFQNQKIIE